MALACGFPCAGNLHARRSGGAACTGFRRASGTARRQLVIFLLFLPYPLFKYYSLFYFFFCTNPRFRVYTIQLWKAGKTQE